MMAEWKSLYDYITEEIPDFQDFLRDSPDWYKQEVDYGVARRLLDFAQLLHTQGNTAELSRLMRRVESGMRQPENISGALCLDFVQPIADLPAEDNSALLAMLGVDSRSCYDSQ
jgi:hypothetical protein